MGDRKSGTDKEVRVASIEQSWDKKIHTSSGSRDTGASQDNNPLVATRLDVLCDSGQAPLGEGLWRAAEAHGGLVLTHLASEPARDTGSRLILVAASSTYLGGSQARDAESICDVGRISRGGCENKEGLSGRGGGVTSSFFFIDKTPMDTCKCLLTAYKATIVFKGQRGWRHGHVVVAFRCIAPLSFLRLW